MRNLFKVISLLFFLGGVGIIIAASFFFLKDVQETKLFYLNMTATCFVYAIVLLRATDIFGSVDKVAKNSSGYGIMWYGVWFYFPLAFGLIVCSIVYGLSFNFCLIGHFTLLFILLLFFFLGSEIKNNVNEVMGNIEERKSGLREISTQIDFLEMQCKFNKSSSYQEAVNKLRDGVRFVTASDNPAAVAFENKLIEKIKLITSQIEHNSQPAEVIDAEFDECMSIIELRKKQY